MDFLKKVLIWKANGQLPSAPEFSKELYTRMYLLSCSHLPAAHSTHLIVSSSRPRTGVTNSIEMLGLILRSAEHYVPKPAKNLSRYLTLYIDSLKSMGCANKVKPVLTHFSKQEWRRSSSIKHNSSDKVLKRAKKATRSRRHLKPGWRTRRVNSHQKQLVMGLIRRLQRYFSVIQSDISGKSRDSEAHYAVYQTASRW